MSIEEQDLVHLARCVALAEEALGQGHAPFGSILVDSEGHVLFEDRNRDTGLFGTRHPELAIAQWAEANIPRPLRGVLTVYTSGEHCPMCAAAHAWAGLGRIVSPPPPSSWWTGSPGSDPPPGRSPPCGSPTSSPTQMSTAPHRSWRRVCEPCTPGTTSDSVRVGRRPSMVFSPSHGYGRGHEAAGVA